MTEVFTLLPASPKPLWWLAGLGLFFLIVLGLVGYTAYWARHSRVVIGDGRLEVVGALATRSIPLDDLRLDAAAVVDLRTASERTPRLRTFGVGLPGFSIGWFRLRSGEKAFVYLTSRESVVYLPTSLGWVLLLSVERPEDMLAALRAR